MNFRDKTGDRVARLTVIRRVENIGKNAGWLCRCDCGAETVVSNANLGRTKSCGCLRSERAARLGKEGRLHGRSKTHLYKVWSRMRDRCNNPQAADYSKYGGRGIEVCGEWEDFEVFARWADKYGYREGLTIDRMDNDGNYGSGNCRWVDWDIQNNNKSNSHWLTFNGKTLTASQWARELGLPVSTVIGRANKGCPINEVLRTKESP